MKDQREFFRVTQQQLPEEQQRVPPLVVKSWVQDGHSRQIPVSADVEGQALCFDRCRAAGEAEEKPSRWH